MWQQVSAYINSIQKKVGHHSEFKSQGPCQNEYTQYRLNVGDFYHPVEKGIVGCKGTWLCGGKCSEN